MSIKINTNISTRNKKGVLTAYKSGEVIKLSDDDEKDLVTRGFAETVVDVNTGGEGGTGK